MRLTKHHWFSTGYDENAKHCNIPLHNVSHNCDPVSIHLKHFNFCFIYIRCILLLIAVSLIRAQQCVISPSTIFSRHMAINMCSLFSHCEQGSLCPIGCNLFRAQCLIFYWTQVLVNSGSD